MKKKKAKELVQGDVIVVPDGRFIDVGLVEYEEVPGEDGDGVEKVVDINREFRFPEDYEMEVDDGADAQG